MRTHSLITLTLAVGLLAGPAASAHTSPVTARKIIAQARAAQKAWPCASSPAARKMIRIARAAQETAVGWALVSASEQASARLAQEASR